VSDFVRTVNDCWGAGIVLGQMFVRRALVSCTLILMMLAVPVAQARLSHAERSVVKRVNKLRARYGVHSLRSDTRLSRAADAHSRDMLHADFFAHNSSNGTSTYDRVRRYRRSNLIGETLAYMPVAGDTSPRSIMRMWINSPGHLAVLTTGRFRRIGVAKRRGTLFGRRVTIWTADLASRR
jgi:uncharacterized protein YkwD